MAHGVVTFRVIHRRREMYIGNARLCVCLSVRGRMPTLLDGPGCNLGNGRGPLVVHCWADLQSVHEFHCYDDSAVRICSRCTWQHSGEREMSASTCLWLWLRTFIFVVYKPLQVGFPPYKLQRHHIGSWHVNWQHSSYILALVGHILLLLLAAAARKSAKLKIVAHMAMKLRLQACSQVLNHVWWLLAVAVDLLLADSASRRLR